MKFKIEGADPHTGEDRSMIVDAIDDSEAEVIARQSGLLVSTVRPSGHAEALDYMAAGSVRPQSIVPIANSRVPDYKPIVKGAKLLRRSAQTYTVLAGILIVLGAVVCFGSIAAVATKHADPVAVVSGIVIMLAAFLVGAWLLNVATMLRLAAELSIAMRDLTRNSFR